MKDIYINLNNINYGLEFEFADTPQNIIKEAVKNLYPEWNVISDNSCINYNLVTKEVKGGEVISPILTLSDKFQYNEIENVLTILNNNSAIVNENTAFHIHFNASQAINNYSYLNLLELWLAFEPVIYRFGFSKEINGRKLIKNFAAPLRCQNKLILDIIDSCNNNKIKINDLQTFLPHEDNIFTKNLGLNLENIISNKTKETVEIRCCDGTLNYNDVITTITFFQKLFEISINPLDIEYLRYINNQNAEFYPISKLLDKYRKADIILFEELLLLMNINQNEEEQFIKKYIKKR